MLSLDKYKTSNLLWEDKNSWIIWKYNTDKEYRKKILEIIRIQNIEQLLKISGWGMSLSEKNDIKLNNEVIWLSKEIINLIEIVLEIKPEELSKKSVKSVIKDIWEKLEKEEKIEYNFIWTWLKKVSFRVENIYLRYQRLKNSKNWLTDKLTGIANRRWIENEIQKVIDLKNRENTDSSILFIDIDNFKSINDRYWHNSWDEVLKQVAIFLKKHFREGDIIWRWWWEEFIIILPKTNIQKATIKAEKIRKEIEISLYKSVNLSNEKITISIWVWKTEINEDTLSLLERTDKALYAAKNQWKNIVIKQRLEQHSNCKISCNNCELLEKCIFDITKK